MLPRSLYRLVKRTARLQREASGVVASAQAHIDGRVIELYDAADAHSRGIQEGGLGAAKGAEGLFAGPEWWWGVQKEADSLDAVVVRTLLSIGSMPRGSVGNMPRTLAAYYMRLKVVRLATAEEVEREKRRTAAPGPIADIGGRLRTARRIHHAMPDGSGPTLGRHPPRRARGVRVPPD